MHPNRNAMLTAMGIVRYRRTAARPAVEAVPLDAPKARPSESFARALGELGVAPAPATLAPATFAPVNLTPVTIAPASVATPAKPAAVSKAREAATRAEFVLPGAELQRFAQSKLYQHLLLVLKLDEVPVVENSVLSDTALYFETPGTSKLKLGALSVLRQTWRAKRQAWLAIRLWRKAAKR
jgi:hypothetical protein